MTLKNKLYISWIILLSSIVVIDLITTPQIIPYNTPLFSDIFWPTDTVITFKWCITLVALVCSLSPLINRQKIGLLVFIPLTIAICKPVLLDKPKKETINEFFYRQQIVLDNTSKEYTAKPSGRYSNDTINKLGFQSIYVTDSTVAFVIRSFLDNSSGLIKVMSKKTPKSVIGGSASFDYIEGKWYTFHEG